MNKKVIAINSSRRKKNTYGILQKLKEDFGKRNIDVEIINLFDNEIKDCLGCEQCLRGKSCPHKDDANILMNKLKECDGIILSSPIYMGGVSGKLKVFIDRTCRWFHRPELVGKPVLLVATTAASGLKETIKFLEKTAVQWGAFPAGSIGRTVRNLNNPISSSEYDNFVKHLIMDRYKYRPKMSQLIFFQVQKVLAEKILPIDKEYWKEKNWLNMLYYFECSINPFNQTISKGFYKMLSKKVVKVEE
jgi:multimeric flavodoxin WrbA